MKAKLIKTQEGYTLNDVEGNPIGQTFGKFKGKKLSLKNCQAIELGYDLDELANESSRNNLRTPLEKPSFTYGYKEGAKAILELLGDNKYSEEDVKKAFEMGEDFGSLPFSSYTTSKRLNKKEYIQSLQQTEWDVFFNPDEKDSEGCLILRRL